MKPTIYDKKSANFPNNNGYHPSHAEISSVEGDALKKAGLPVYGESQPAGRKPRHNRDAAANVKTERLF